MKPQGTDQGPSAPSAQTRSTSRGTGTETLLEQMLERHNMLTALKRVEANKGAPGVDGMETKDLRLFLRDNWERIRSELQAASYAPMPVRRVEIPKPDGGLRLLGIPACLDRLLQQALMQVLTPIFAPTFSEWSFGFRQGRRCCGCFRCSVGLSIAHRTSSGLQLWFVSGWATWSARAVECAAPRSLSRCIPVNESHRIASERCGSLCAICLPSNQ